MAGEGNEEMAMGGVTVGNWTGMVGTGAESQKQLMHSQKQLMHRAGLGVIGTSGGMRAGRSEVMGWGAQLRGRRGRGWCGGNGLRRRKNLEN